MEESVLPKHNGQVIASVKFKDLLSGVEEYVKKETNRVFIANSEGTSFMPSHITILRELPKSPGTFIFPGKQMYLNQIL